MPSSAFRAAQSTLLSLGFLTFYPLDVLARGVLGVQRRIRPQDVSARAAWRMP